MSSVWASVALLCQLAVGLRFQRNSDRTLCDSDSVRAACENADVAVAELADSLVVSQSSLKSFLENIGMPEGEVSCSDLCSKTVGSLPSDALPPAPDVGCYWEQGGKICDLDLSDDAILDMAWPNTSRPNRTNTPMRKEPLRVSAFGMEEKEQYLEALASEENPEATFAELQVMICNHFSIWPLLGSAPVDVGLEAYKDPQESKRIQETQAFVTRSINKMNKGQATQSLKKWFGKSDGATLNKVKKAVRQVRTVMNACVLRYHPEETGYYGWVYSPYDKNSNGKYVIHLGGAYINGPVYDKLGTLTHEASHFKPHYTDDHIYCDLSGCLRMARNNPRNAFDNADHLAFFIDELNGGAMAKR